MHPLPFGERPSCVFVSSAAQEPQKVHLTGQLYQVLHAEICKSIAREENNLSWWYMYIVMCVEYSGIPLPDNPQ